MIKNNRFNLRVWNKVTKTYKSCDSLGDIRLIYTKDGYRIDTSNSVKGKDIVIEQCTGLRDKKRRLIYEGDIVVDCESGTGTVIWDEENVLFAVRYSDDEEFPFDEGSYYYKVIGNVHENPELLEEEE